MDDTVRQFSVWRDAVAELRKGLESVSHWRTFPEISYAIGALGRAEANLNTRISDVTRTTSHRLHSCNDEPGRQRET